MLTIAIRLTNRTYGACPWDRAHIEGSIETIPSSTRILRAIVSGAFASGFGDTPAIKSVLKQLAAAPPIYYIPKGEYVPFFDPEKKPISVHSFELDIRKNSLQEGINAIFNTYGDEIQDLKIGEIELEEVISGILSKGVLK